MDKTELDGPVPIQSTGALAKLLDLGIARAVKLAAAEVPRAELTAEDWYATGFTAAVLLMKEEPAAVWGAFELAVPAATLTAKRKKMRLLLMLWLQRISEEEVRHEPPTGP